MWSSECFKTSKSEYTLKNKCIIGFVAGVILSLGCNKEAQEQEMILAAIEVKKELFIKEAREKCKKDMMKQADLLADSILLERIQVRNGVVRPEKPKRPETPEVDFKDTFSLIKPGRKKPVLQGRDSSL